jgi:DNA-binding CsgD family transcriptional regulator
MPLGQEAGALWLPHGDTLVARAAWGASGADRESLEEMLAPLRFPRGVGLPGHAWVKRGPVQATIGAPDHDGHRPSPPGELRPTLGLPALAGEDLLGVIELYSTSDRKFSARLMHVLSAAGHELGAFFARRRGELELSPLTAREVEVLALAAHGLPVSRIGEQLTISRGTVKSHLEHIYAKLGVVNRTAAVAQALRAGLIE